MVLHGFRPQTRDIDLGCSTRLADRLERQGYFVSQCDDGTRKILYAEDIEIYENWLEGSVEIISGVPVVCVDGLIQMKKELGREKDLADIAFMCNVIAHRFLSDDVSAPDDMETIGEARAEYAKGEVVPHEVIDWY